MDSGAIPFGRRRLAPNLPRRVRCPFPGTRRILSG
jgi:hypothetical protein